MKILTSLNDKPGISKSGVSRVDSRSPRRSRVDISLISNCVKRYIN